MTEKQINEHLKNGIYEIAPNCMETILEKIENEKTESVAFRKRWMNGTVTKMMPVLACFCVFVGIYGGYQYNTKTVATVIELDVNPSIEFGVNKSDKVIKVKALNDDGEEVIENLSLEKMMIKEATLCVMDEMVDKGFLTQEKATVLVSVENKNEEKTAKIKEDLSNEIVSHLEKSNIEITVLKQTMKEDETSKNMVKEYNISTGKALLVKTLVEENPQLKEEELARMTVDEIVKEATKEKMDVGGILEKKSTVENDDRKKGESKDNTSAGSEEKEKKDSSSAVEDKEDADNTKKTEKSNVSASAKTPIPTKSESSMKEGKKEEPQSPTKDDQNGEVKNPAKGDQNGEAKNPAKDDKNGEAKNPAKDDRNGDVKNPTKGDKNGETKNPTKGEGERPTQRPIVTEMPKPTEKQRPTDIPKTTDMPRPTKEPKPTDIKRPTKEPKPTDMPRPTKEIKPTDMPRPTDIKRRQPDEEHPQEEYPDEERPDNRDRYPDDEKGRR